MPDRPGTDPAPAEGGRADMPVHRTDAIGALRWGLRRYVGLFAACVLGVAVLLPLLLQARPATYEAEALVVAQRLDLSLLALPRYGEVVFDNGEVARRVAARYGDNGDLDDIVPERVDLQSEQDSILFVVFGRDPDPTVAAGMANLAADVFTAALNEPGVGVGVFTVQSTATPPGTPVQPTPSWATTVPVGIGAGGVLGLAAIMAILMIRRPVLDVGDVEDTTGLTVLGRVTLAQAGEPTRDATGLIPVCRRLLDDDPATIRLVGPRASDDVRGHVARAVVDLLGEIRPVQFLVEPKSTAAPISSPRAQADHDRRQITVVDGNGIGCHLAETFTVLVVPQGTGAAALREAVDEHVDGIDRSAVLLVRTARRSARVTSAASDDAVVPPPSGRRDSTDTTDDSDDRSRGAAAARAAAGASASAAGT